MIDINDQVAVIQRWWDNLGVDKLNTMKSLKDVSGMFLERKIFADQSSAVKYIVKMTGLTKSALEKHGMEFNDFLSIFLKGILKQVVTSVFETVKDFKRTDAWSQWTSGKAQEKETQKADKAEEPEPFGDDVHQAKPISWKLTEFQRQQLIQLLLKQPEDGEKFAKRPVLDNLYNMRYRYDPDKYKNANYQAFLDKHIGKKSSQEQKYEIELDDFIKNISFIKNEVEPDPEEEKMKLLNLSSDEFDNMKQKQLEEQIAKKEKFDLMKRYDEVFGLANNRQIEDD